MAHFMHKTVFNEELLTFMQLADAFIQSECIQVKVLSFHAFNGNQTFDLSRHSLGFKCINQKLTGWANVSTNDWKVIFLSKLFLITQFT